MRFEATPLSMRYGIRAGRSRMAPRHFDRQGYLPDKLNSCRSVSQGQAASESLVADSLDHSKVGVSHVARSQQREQQRLAGGKV